MRLLEDSPGGWEEEGRFSSFRQAGLDTDSLTLPTWADPVWLEEVWTVWEAGGQPG